MWGRKMTKSDYSSVTDPDELRDVIYDLEKDLLVSEESLEELQAEYDELEKDYADLEEHDRGVYAEIHDQLHRLMLGLDRDKTVDEILEGLLDTAH